MKFFKKLCNLTMLSVLFIAFSLITLSSSAYAKYGDNEYYEFEPCSNEYDPDGNFKKFKKYADGKDLIIWAVAHKKSGDYDFSGERRITVRNATPAAKEPGKTAGTWLTTDFLFTAKKVKSGETYNAMRYAPEQFEVDKYELLQVDFKSQRMSIYLYGVDREIFWKKFNANSDNGFEITPDNHVYVQPIIAVRQVNGNALKRITTLAAWKGAVVWGDPSTFKDHYDQPYPLPVPKVNVTVHYIKKGTVGADKPYGESLAPNVTIKNVSGLSGATIGEKFLNTDILPADKEVITVKPKSKAADPNTMADGDKWALSGVYVRRKSFPEVNKQNLAIKEAGNDAKEEVTVSVDGRYQCFGKGVNNKIINGSKRGYGTFLSDLKKTKLKIAAEDTGIYFTYTKVSPTGPQAPVTLKHEKEVWEGGKAVWKPAVADKLVTTVPATGYEHTFVTKLTKNPTYGLAETKAVDNAKPTISLKNELTNSQTNSTPYFYDTATWKSSVTGISKVKYKIPEASSITVTGRYRARVPHAILKYKYEKAGNKYTLIGEASRGKPNIPGKPIPFTFPEKDGSDKLTAIQTATGEMKDYDGKTKDSWKPNELPSGCQPLPLTTKEVAQPEKPMLIIAIYGDEPPIAPPTTPEGTPEPGEAGKPTITDKVTDLPWDLPEGSSDSGGSSSKGENANINDDMQGFIFSDPAKSGQFKSEISIPTSEFQGVKAHVSTYLTEGVFQQHDVTATYPVTVKKNYTLVKTSTDDKGNVTQSSTSQEKSQTVNIKRRVTYYTLKEMQVWAPQDATYWNYSLEGGKQTVDQKGNPGQSAKITNSKGGKLKHPKFPATLSLPPETIVDGSIPSEDWFSEADAVVGELQAQNDNAIFLDDKKIQQELLQPGYSTKPDKPVFPKVSGTTADPVFYKDDVEIAPTKLNGVFNSSAAVQYTIVSSTASKSGGINYGMRINKVTLHTPVINNFSLIKDNKYVQLNKPKQEKGIVLDTVFTINMPTLGQHIGAPGYGNNNYKKYVDKWQVQFPFDVYSYDGTKFYVGNTWIDVKDGKTQFIAATWNEEGTKLLKSRVLAINAEANNKVPAQELNANFSLNNYVATKEDVAQVSGRIYGAKIFDVGDYPNWQSVFRKKGSYAKTGFTYDSGTNNQNGFSKNIQNRYTFPMVNGAHPTKTTLGTVKRGYVVRYMLTTIGEMAGDKDYIRIKPRFYFVKKDGTGRQEVDVYYDETFDGSKKRFVKMGSQLDSTNKKYLQVGDDGMAIPNSILAETAKVLGFSSTNAFTSQKRAIWTYTNIMIGPSMRTMMGTNHVTMRSTDNKALKLKRPESVMYNTKAKSVQDWYCTYYVPSNTHAVPKGFNLAAAVKNGVNYKEKFWLKDGYLLINFDVQTVNDGSEEFHLNYGATGNCNMWEMESQAKLKIDNRSNRFTFQNGDFVLFQLGENGSAADDYGSGGTH